MTFASLARCGAATVLCALLAGCGTMGDTGPSPFSLSYARPGRVTTPPSSADDPTLFPDDEDSDSGPARVGGTRVQCVPYARAHSDIDLHGDAYTWWDKAEGIYQRGAEPVEGAVMVLKNYAGKHHAHVAVVRRQISAREIRIDHANWLNDGAIYVNDPVLDVSAANDWSEVKVWNIRSGSWGTRVYEVQGFIGPAAPESSPVVASYSGLVKDPIARLIAASGNLPSAPRFKRSTTDH
jgi:hypothetical protein